MLAGREVREQMFSQVKDLIHQLDLGMLPITVFFPYLPIPAHRNRDRCVPCLIFSCRYNVHHMYPASSQSIQRFRTSKMPHESAWLPRAREELGAIYKKIVDARRAAGVTSAQERDMMQA